MTEEKERLSLGEQAHNEEKNRLKRQIRDAKDEIGETQRREAEISQRKHDLVSIDCARPHSCFRYSIVR